MESWRERGFVPDSDEEDGFDSQEPADLGEDGNGPAQVQDGAVPDTTQGEVDAGHVPDNRRDGEKGLGSQDGAIEDAQQPALSQSADGKDTVVSEGGNHGTQTLSPSAEELVPVSEPPKEMSQELAIAPASQENMVVEGEMTTEAASRSQDLPAPNVNPPSTPRAMQPHDIWDVPSSPDELQLDNWHAQEQPRHESNAEDQGRTRSLSNASSQSSLSSAPSSLKSQRLNEDDTGEMEQEQTVVSPRDDLEDLLSPLDIPEDILQQLSQPARRSLRERNPIQLHPYLLEDAKYQSLMKARGVRPVRIAQCREALRAAATDSQNREFVDPQFPSSSPGPDSRFPPSSPAESRPMPESRLQRDTPSREHQRDTQRPDQPSTGTRPRTYKRRKITHSEAQRDNHQPVQRDTSQLHGNDISATSRGLPVFDILPSPPRSGSISSAHTPNVPGGFRFPGLSPPMTTPVTEPKVQSTDTDNNSLMDLPSSIADQRPPDAMSISSQSEPDSDEDDSSNEVKKFQRRIKGVLPASWLRLDLKKQEERIRGQQNRDSTHRSENAKGVAKTINRSNTVSKSGPRWQWASMMDLADNEEDGGDDGDRNPDGDDAGQALADIVGFGDPFHGQAFDDDIPEDNAIDYMLPPIPRGPRLGQGRKQGVKRKSERDGTHAGGNWKRARLKQQTRITDPVYGARKGKQSSTTSRRSAILNAPDIAQRPRKEQPPFLRVAARQARLRQKGGRRPRALNIANLGSKSNTRNTQISSRQGRSGAPKQTRLTQSRSRPDGPERRQPLAELSTNEQLALNGDNDQVMDDRTIDSFGENGGNTVPTSYQNDQASISKSHSTNLTRPPASERVGNKWVIRRNLAISSFSRNAPRPAVPEIEDNDRHFQSPSLFQRSLSQINRAYRLTRVAQTHKPNASLDRFLPDSTSSVAPSGNQQAVPVEDANDLNKAPAKHKPPARRRQLKKRPPKQLVLDHSDRQESPITVFREPDPLRVEDIEFLGTRHQRPGNLFGFQPSYAIDFGIVPVYPGTFFHESTFLGSGEFARLSKILTRDLDKNTRVSSISFGGRNYHWGAWNETVSSELGFAFETLTEGIEKNGNVSAEADSESITTQSCHTYLCLIRYVTETLSFIDPVDRAGFVTRAHDLVSKLNEHLTAVTSSTPRNGWYFVKLCSYNLVFANKIRQIASHNLVDRSVANDTLHLVRSVARQLLSLASNQEIMKFLEDNKKGECRDAGVRDNHPCVEAFVVAQHLLRGSDSYEGWLESITTEVYSYPKAGEPSNSNNIQGLETGWHSLFTTLPLNEIDQSGIARIGSRFKQSFDNWKLVQRLLAPVLDDDANSSTQPKSYVNYCRVLFRRCFHLINDWGWRDCKPILDPLYDFFARRTLYNLPHEEVFGSPNFLEDLDRTPSLTVTPRDSSFQILLKIIGSGLRFMSKAYDKKKIRNSAWRLLPNHGRVYPKEMPLRREDLDALRNHHDLLCTLYWAVPDGCRPRLEAIKNLVDPASSHRETCKISLRSWMRLVRFKLSTDEDVSGLDPFGDWHSYFVSELLKQHSQARTEVEAQSNGDSLFSHQVIERTISQNQQQIELLLSSALGGLQSAVQLSPSLEHAWRLMSKMPIQAILGIFNPKLPRVNSIISNALQVVVAYTKKCDAPVIPAVAASSDEDSQEYGDWKEIFGHEDSRTSPGIEYVQKVLHPAVSRLVSNCFGEDQSPEDAILLIVLDCWTSVAHTLAIHGLRHWDSYISPYDGDSWAALRSTVQMRKFTPQFLASCIEKDGRFFFDCKAQVLKMWMSTLVERTSMLKFQHRLTEALLNLDPANPLLKNLPFTKNRMDDRYSITLEAFSQRRLSLISSLLSNMREHVQEIEDVETWEYKMIKQEYNGFIQGLMSSMKSNYQELGNGVQSAQGAYVDFVHCVVGFLQQHARDISAIDSFFTDPKSFPLPSADPRYIVAKLKSYEPKLSTEKAVKALIVFIQGVSERAATDGEQVYLVDQLRESMANTYEGGNQPTLRAVLLQCAFPAYLEMAFKHPAAWILSRPILQTIGLTFKELLFNIDTTDPDCVSSVTNIFTAVFQATYQAFYFLTDDPDMLKEPGVQVTAASFIEMVISSLPIVEYIDRATDVGEQLIFQIQAFQQFARFSLSRLRDELIPYSLEEFIRLSAAFSAEPAPTSTPGFVEDLRHSASRELHSYISENYSRHQGKYYFTRRSSQPKEVKIDPSLAVLLDGGADVVFEGSARTFLDHLQRLDLFGDVG